MRIIEILWCFSFKKYNFKFLFYRLFNLKNSIYYVNIFNIAVTIVIIIITLFFYFSNFIDCQYLNIIYVSIFPIYINFVMYSLLLNRIFDENFIIYSYTLLKSCKIKKIFIIDLFLTILSSMKLLSILFIFLFLFNINSIESLILLFLIFIYCILFIFIISIRIVSFVKFDIDDINSNTISCMMSNYFEDYVILGVPFVLLSVNLLKYKILNSLSFTIIQSILLLIVLLIYLIFKYFYVIGVLNVKIKKYNKKV